MMLSHVRTSLALLAVYLYPVLAAADGPVVATLYGKVQGKYTDRAKVFTSIPYVRPPIKEYRCPHEPWDGVVETVADPPGCPQSVPCDLPTLLCPAVVSEDCLFLNVFTPLTARDHH